MTMNEVQEMIKQCTEDCKKRILLMEKWIFAILVR